MNENKGYILNTIIFFLWPLLNIFYYPIYRTYLEIKVTQLSKDFDRDMIKEAKALVKKNGRLRGLSYYLLNDYIGLFGTIWNHKSSINAFVTAIASFAIQYPIFLNSNFKALDLPDYTSLKNFFDITYLYSNTTSYKGVGFHILSKLTIYFPFVNLLSYHFESVRLAYVFGPYYGHNFKNYKEAYKFLSRNEYLKAGKLHYNFLIHLSNGVYTFSFIYNFIYGKPFKIQIIIKDN